MELTPVYQELMLGHPIWIFYHTNKICKWFLPNLLAELIHLTAIILFQQNRE